MIPTSEAVQSHFQRLGAQLGLHGPTGEVIAILAAARYDPVAFADVCTRHGVAREAWFRGQLLDLILGLLAGMAEVAPLPADLLRDARALKIFLHVEEGEFFG